MAPDPATSAAPQGSGPQPAVTPSAVSQPGEPQPAVSGEPGSEAPPPRPQEPRRARPIFVLLGVVLAVALAIGLFTGIGTGTSGGRPKVGTAAPSFSLPRLGGRGSVGIPGNGGGNGRPAVLVFYASWCPPCRQEIPALAAAYRRQQRSGGPLARVRLIGVDGYDPTPNALRFARASGITFPVGVDAKYDVTEGLYYLTGDPDAVFVRGDGTLAGIVQGSLTVAELHRWEHRLVGSGQGA